MATQTEENYLKALYSLTNLNEEVNATELGKYLRVSLPTVNSMVNNLLRQGLVNYEKYKPISLTEEGKKEAALVLRKHRLTEMYLFEKMGFGWEEVHEIAEQIEHITSPAFFNRMDELLGYPTLDPHGSPIPDPNGKMIQDTNEKLSHYKAGDRVKLVALAYSSTDFLNFLTNRELTLGVIIEIKTIEVYDGSMTISYLNRTSETLSQQICERLLVEIVEG